MTSMTHWVEPLREGMNREHAHPLFRATGVDPRSRRMARIPRNIG